MTEAEVPLSRNRDFQLLWIGQLTSEFGSWSSAIAMPLVVLAVTGSPFDAGFVRFAGTAPLALFYLPAGVAADRFDRRGILVATESIRLLMMGSVALGVLVDRVSLTHLILAAAVVGACGAFFQIAELAAIPRIVGARQVQAALAQNGVRYYAGVIAGQAAGGVLYAIGRTVPFVVDTLSYVASLLSVMAIRARLQEARPVAHRPRLREGVAWLWRNDVLRVTTLLSAGNNLVVNSLYLVLIVYAQQLGASAPEIGVMLAAVGVGGLSGAAAARRLAEWLSFRQVVALSLSLKAILIPLLLVIPNTYVIAVLFGGMFFIDATWSSVVGARQLAVIPDELRGRVTGAMYLLGLGTVTLGALLVGALLQVFGTQSTIVGLGAIMGATAVAGSLNRAIAQSSSQLQSGTSVR